MMDMGFSADEPEDYFGEECQWQSWLDVEAGLALTQSEMGIIPEAVGPKIAESAKLSRFNLDVLREDISRTMAPVYALSEALAREAGSAGAYVHWGATTQNIIETGRLLVLKRIHRRIHRDLEQLLLILSEQAEQYASLVMVGRTNRQNALPITYGFKLAGWIDELLRVRTQLHEIEPRLFQLRFGGAIGGYHSLGGVGFELSKRLAKRFELEPSLVPNRTSIDPLIEYITKLSMLGNAIGRMSSELYLLTTQELREITEVQSSGVIGSSTMPQKVNPKHIVRLTTRAAQLRGQAAVALAIPYPSHDGDTVSNQYISGAVSDTCQLATDVLDSALRTLPLMRPNTDGMKRNYERSRQAMASEGIMMRLAKHLGRPMAHDIVHAAIGDVEASGQSLSDLLKASPMVSSALSEAELEQLFSDTDNFGLCAEIALQTVEVVQREILSKAV